jgi:hypothetical protein
MRKSVVADNMVVPDPSTGRFGDWASQTAVFSADGAQIPHLFPPPNFRVLKVPDPGDAEKRLEGWHAARVDRRSRSDYATAEARFRPSHGLNQTFDAFVTAPISRLSGGLARRGSPESMHTGLWKIASGFAAGLRPGMTVSDALWLN